MTDSKHPEAMNEELDLEQLHDVSGGFWGILKKAFTYAVKEGAREIEETQRTGELPSRFHTPITDVGGNSGGGSPISSDCTLNNGDYGRHY